jgi:O-succinylbenzoic acid--CoA ligase
VCEQRQRELAGRSHHIIATTDADEFMTELMAGIATGVPIFLANPTWGQVEWLQMRALTATVDRLLHGGQIMIPTGGTSGQLKFASHTPTTLTAAVRGFQKFFRVSAVNSYCALPLHHVSGLMQFWRAAMSGGQFYSVRQQLGQPVGADAFISLVPTQLQRLLAIHADWLQQFRVVSIGGAPVWPTLLEQARAQCLPLSPSYGMTETAAMVTALLPADFLAGEQSSGQVLPHAQIQVAAGGRITIRAQSLMLGYYPHCIDTDELVTDDLGAVDERGHLQILGRDSHKIITGGEKVWPPEVEAAIRATGLVEDVCVFGMPDPEWGERVVAIYVGAVAASVIQTQMQQQLSKFKQPKTWVAVTNIPRNGQGKVDRQWCQRCYQQQQSP